MKKYLSLALALLLVFSLAACGNYDDPAKSDPQGDQGQDVPGTFEVTNAQDKFDKTLVSLTYAEGEEVESIYYKMVSVDDSTYYEVQPDGEDEPLRLPLSDTVIYGIDEDDCHVQKVNLDIEENGKTYNISQYRLFVRLESNVVYTLDGTRGDTPEPVGNPVDVNPTEPGTETEAEPEAKPESET